MAQKFLTDIELTRGLKDSSGDLGNSGQVLSSTGSALNWINANSAASVVYQDGFTGNGSTTAFTLANSIDNENKTQVYIDGVYQHKDTYSLNGTTLTFSTAPPNSSDIEVISFSSVSSADDILYDTDFASAGLMKTNGSGTYSIVTDNSSNWNTAYTYSQVGHLPLAGGTLTGNLTVTGNIMPAAENAHNIGSASVRWEDLYVDDGYIRNIYLDDKIIHNGDTDTWIHLETDVISFRTGGTDRLVLNNTTATITNDLHIGGTNKARFKTDGTNTIIDAIPGSSSIIFRNSGAVEKMRLDSSGRLGIGTTGPDRKLDVSGTGNVYAKIQSTNSTAAGIELDTAGGSTENWLIQADESVDGLAIYDLGRTAYRMAIDDAGRVGIGTTSPSAKLHVHATSGDGLVRITGDNIINSGGTIKGFNNGLAFNVAASGGGSETEAMRMQGNGDVLMGNTVVNPATGFASQRGFGYDNSTGNVQIAATSGNALTVGRNESSDGAIITLRKESNVVGTLGSNTTSGQMLLDISGSSSNGNIRFVTNGGEVMRMTSAYNVVIGTTTSSNKLFVANGNIAINNNHSFMVGGDNDTAIGRLKNTSGVLNLEGDGTRSIRFGSGTNGEVVRIDNSNQRVGIGTTSPTQKLDVVGTGGNTNIRVYDSSANSEVGLQLQNDAKTWQLQNWGSGGDNLRLLNNAGNIVQLWDDNGNVMIGNANDPSYKLQVNVTGNGETALAFMNSAVTSDGGGSTNIRFVSANNNNWASASYSAYDHIWYGNGTERMRVHGSTGRVSIGSTTASANSLTLSGTGTELDLTNTSSSGKNYRIASTSSGVLEFIDKTANVERFRIHSDGKIGIGVTPTNNFHVGGVSNYNGIEITGAGASRPSLKFSNINQGALAQIYATEGNALTITTNNTDAIHIDNSQDVGIGTTSPSQKLSIGGSDGNLDVAGPRIYMGTHGGNNGSTILTMRNYDATLVNAGDVQNIIQMTGRYWSGATSQLVETRITSIHQIANGNGGSALGFETQHGGSAPSEKMRLDRNGNLGIATNSVNARLDVRGAVATGMATEDEELGVTLNGGSAVSSGTIEMTQGWTGTMSSGDTIVFRYNAASWKSWALEFMFVSTNGMSDGKIGGYNNNSSGRTTDIGSNSHGMSISYSRDNAGGGTGQTNIITFTFTGLGIHPFCHFKYFQSGGDGRPVASKASITLNS